MKRPQTEIHVSVSRQRLDLRRKGKLLRSFPVSTSRFGLGTEEGSLKTPLGKFRVAQKIGHDQPSGTIFQARIPLPPDDPPPDTEDWITSRILWLDGLEEENANTRHRYIYIHGTRHEDKIGTPDSHGCIRMRNADVIELFGLVEEGTPVEISQ